MKPKKLDRFERLVGKIVREADYKPDIYHDDVVELLRQQHRWMVRMVKESGKIYQENCDQSAAMDLLHDILDHLTRRAL